MRVALIEDELPALEHLGLLLSRIVPEARVIAQLRTVRETRAWLGSGAPADLILADIQLGDGLSLDALADTTLDVPIIFVTAYDHHLAPALASNGIAYLLKPIREADLAAAIGKLRRFERHFIGNLGQMAQQIARHVSAPATVPRRLVARRGLDWVSLPVEELAWFTVRHGVTWVMDKRGVEAMVEEPLGTLESRLGDGFFRANRWFLVSLSAIVRVRPEGKGRLALVVHGAAEPVVVPQEKAAAFRAWFGME